MILRRGNSPPKFISIKSKFEKGLAIEMISRELLLANRENGATQTNPLVQSPQYPII